MKFYLKSNFINLQKKNKMEHSDEKLAKDISYHGKMVEIWSVNETKLRKQMRENQ
jgi:hypothetical protein